MQTPHSRLLVAAVDTDDVRLGVRNASDSRSSIPSVTEATFTTQCAGVTFRPDPSFVVPDQPSCIVYPNGTVWRGANKTTASLFREKTGNIKNTVAAGSLHIDYVAFLPNQAPVTVLANLGISRLNASLRRDSEGIRLETTALYADRSVLERGLM
ncbi:hypothetical protein SPRG_00236 [Saprolegnia parasitica CBS 223.65]|uniref:Uncharacterized protein n=1 Tax=Saprolegnia parasitica (strain CBS 223.65) TaxID=695850 RepID=A0A067D8Q0_SAPPC|nr:hypothetical protein SPRG_00236 [Saprolegnia parasitica CBS 223.65]KDO35387.1 hypothetical protein SPRG_00236 [Saprolegnia parasitica CBS 223.65]|eukprot:XP_012193731.1 hypothetical protein SPRG_00236 [Saprolegnia parasitica CBS 223.65]